VFILGQFALLRPVGLQDAARLVAWSFVPHESHVLARRADGLLFTGPITDAEAFWPRDMPLMIGDYSDRVLGYVLLYDISPRDRHMSVEVFATEECPTLVHMEAWLLLLSHTFRSFPVEKIYLHIPEFRACPSAAELAGFKVEGFLTKHVWLEDALWGVQILGLTRDRWNEQRELLVDTLAIQEMYERREASGSNELRTAPVIE
jgi:hypothetical protein